LFEAIEVPQQIGKIPRAPQDGKQSDLLALISKSVWRCCLGYAE